MELSFQGPTFFADADEAQFFAWLYSLPEYEKVIGSGRELHLQIGEPVAPETVRQLLVIFRRWRIEVAPLLPLRSEETRQFALWDADIDAASG